MGLQNSMKIVKTIGGDLYMVTSSITGRFVNLNTGTVCSSIDVIDSVYEISVQEIMRNCKFSENTILYNPYLNYYAVGRIEILGGFEVKALYTNGIPRNDVHGYVSKLHGWGIATQEEISLLHKSLSKINWAINEYGEFVKLITKKEISEKFGIKPNEIKIV